MSFVEPLYLLGLLAAGLPIAIHLINRRQAIRQRFPALALLRKSDRREARSIKVRRWLLMLLRVLAVALLALALAKPYVYSDSAVGSDARLPEAVVLVADDSLSMQNDDWWERARDRLQRELRALKPWDQVALLRTSAPTEGPVPRLVDDHGAVREALGELEAGEASGDLPAALRRADELLEASELPNSRIAVVSDFARGGFPDPPRQEGTVDHPIDEIRIGAEDERSNLAVVGVDYRQRGAAGKDAWAFTARVRNYGRRDAGDVQLGLNIGDRTVATTSLDVPAGDTATETVRHRVDHDGVERGAFDVRDTDALAPDNRRHFTFRPNRRVRTLLVNGDPSSVPYRDELYFLSRAVRSDERDDKRIVPTTVTADGLGSRDLGEFDVVLLANVARLTKTVVEKLERFVDNGGGLFLAMGDQVEPQAYNQKFGDLLPKQLRRVKLLAERSEPNASVKATRLGSVDREHPIFRAFRGDGGQSLFSVTLYRYMLVEPSPAERTEVLASTKDGAPVLLERRAERGRGLLLTTTLDRGWTDLPIQSAYVPLVRRSIFYLARRTTSESRQKHRVGEAITLEVDMLVDDRVILQAPGDRRHVLEPTDGTVTFVPTRSGAFEVWADEATAPERNRLDRLAFSVNVPTVESELRAVEEDALDPWRGEASEGGDGGERASRDRKRVNLWPTLLFIVAIALLTETIIGTRRSILRRIWRRVTLQSDPTIDI